MAGTGRSSSSYSRSRRSYRSYRHNNDRDDYLLLILIFILLCIIFSNSISNKDYDIWFNNTQKIPADLYTINNNFNDLTCNLLYNDTCNFFGKSDVKGYYTCQYNHKLYINSKKNYSVDADGYHNHKYISLYKNKYEPDRQLLIIVMSRCHKLVCNSFINLTIMKDIVYGNFAGYLGSNGTMIGSCKSNNIWN